QRGLDEVVREDLAGERAAARQARQRAVPHERLDADDRVVSPVVRLAELPEMQAGGEERAIGAVGELLDTRVERVAPGGDRRGLEDPGGRVRFHQLDE